MSTTQLTQDDGYGWYWMFAGPRRDIVDLDGAYVPPEDTRGEEFVRCTRAQAEHLATVPADERWAAAQGL